MAPINVEIIGKSYSASNNQKGGINYQLTDLAIVYSGAENGGRVVIVHEKDYLKPIEQRQFNLEPNKKDIYDTEIIDLHKGEEVEKDVNFTRINGKKDKTKIKITAS